MRPWEWANWESDEADLFMTLVHEFEATYAKERTAAQRDAERIAAIKGAGRGA